MCVYARGEHWLPCRSPLDFTRASCSTLWALKSSFPWVIIFFLKLGISMWVAITSFGFSCHLCWTQWNEINFEIHKVKRLREIKGYLKWQVFVVCNNSQLGFQIYEFVMWDFSNNPWSFLYPPPCCWHDFSKSRVMALVENYVKRTIVEIDCSSFDQLNLQSLNTFLTIYYTPQNF